MIFQRFGIQGVGCGAPKLLPATNAITSRLVMVMLRVLALGDKELGISLRGSDDAERWTEIAWWPWYSVGVARLGTVKSSWRWLQAAVWTHRRGVAVGEIEFHEISSPPAGQFDCRRGIGSR